MLVASVLAQIVWKTQTNWMGGPDVLGPVEEWGTQYWQGDSITAATEGQVSLIATWWDYAAWETMLADSEAGEHQGATGEDLFGHPADFNGDGLPDIVAAHPGYVAWYENTGAGFVRHDVDTADPSGVWVCVHAADLDGDGDMDIIAGDGYGLRWMENLGWASSWTTHWLDTARGYHRVSAADMDGDGNLDLVAVDGSGNAGDIWIFWGDGAGGFTSTLAVDLPDGEGWRVYPADFNGDGLLDLYSVYWHAYVFLNNGDRTFAGSFSYTGMRFDGAWAEDIDMDGDMDLVLGGQYDSPYGFYALLNDGSGENFNLVFTVADYSYLDSRSHLDGAIARDIDLDGLPDIAGTLYNTGWFRQEPVSQWPDNPVFTLYEIDENTDYAHWIYAQPLGGGCSPAVDLIVTDKRGLWVYRNHMLQAFASQGWLESSLLEMDSTPGYGGHPLEFYYKACVPNDSALEFWFRGGPTVEACTSSAWIGPFRAPAGVDSASFDLTSYFGTTKLFQYKVVFRGDTQNKDIAVLYEVGLAYEPGLALSEKLPKLPSKLRVYLAGPSTLKLELPYSSPVKIEVYEPTGRLVAREERSLQAGVHELRVPGRGLRLVLLKAGGMELRVKVW